MRPVVEIAAGDEQRPEKVSKVSHTEETICLRMTTSSVFAVQGCVLRALLQVESIEPGNAFSVPHSSARKSTSTLGAQVYIPQKLS